MSRVAPKTVIGGLTYQVAPIAASVGLRVAARLASLIAPVLTANGGTPQEIGAKAVAALLRNPDLADHLEFLCAAFRERTTVVRPSDGKTQSFAVSLADQPTFDEHFAGNYGALLEWLAFALEVNMSSFFDVSPALRAKLAARFAAQSSDAQSPSEMTG